MLENKIREAIIDFVRAGDNSDTELLDKVLHKDFRVNNNGFMGTPGVTIINKEQYLSNIRSGIFGGVPRQMNIEYLHVIESIAIVTIRLESDENHFISYNSMVLDKDDQWKIINNLAIVNPKNKT